MLAIIMKQIIHNGQVTPYYITNDGKCYNAKRDYWLKGQVGKNGYYSYNIRIATNQPKRLYAHRLVAQYYLNNGLDIPIGLEVNHKDGNKLNNKVNNLELVTSQQNSQHALKHHLKKQKTVYQFNTQRQKINEFYNVVEACQITGVSRSNLILELNSAKKRLLNKQWYFSYNSVLSENQIQEYPNTGRSKQVIQFTLDGKYVAQYNSCGEAKRANFPEMKCGTGHISECCRGKIKQYKGYIWKYKDDIV